MALAETERIQLYHQMRRSRAIEDAAWALAGQGRLVGRLYTGHGQEAIPVGIASALADGDVIAPMYRDMGAHLVRGVRPVEVFAQYMGKRASSNGGKDSGLHIGDMARGIVGMISVLPDSLPVAVGVALAFAVRGERHVAMTTFGEGATSTGAFHEAVNMAAVLRLPIVLVCENNGWALSTPAEREVAGGIAERAAGYGIPGVRVDGNDVEAVLLAAREAVARARDGGGPTLLECMTMRMRGHSIIDPADYVPSDMLEAWAARDPLLRHRERLEAAGLWDAEREASLEQAIQAEIDAAVDEAAAMEDPRPEDVHQGVFAVAGVEDATPASPTPLTPDAEAAGGEGAVEMTYHEAIRDALRVAMDGDERVFMLGEDIGHYGGVYKLTEGFLERYGPERVIDTPIAENAIVGAATGAALAGMRPVAEIQFADFIACGFDPLVNMASTIHYRWGQPVPMVVRMPAGATWAGAGPFHSQSMEAWFAQIPGLKVVVPGTPADAKGLMLSAIRDPNPVIVLEQKYLYRRQKGPVPPGDAPVPIGPARLARAGRDATVIAWGTMAVKAVEAAEALAEEGIEVEVVDLRTIVPWDREAVLASVRRTGRALVVCEAHHTASFGAEVAATIAEAAFADLDAPVQRLSGLDTPIPAHPLLEAAYLPDERTIAARLRELVAF